MLRPKVSSHLSGGSLVRGFTCPELGVRVRVSVRFSGRYKKKKKKKKKKPGQVNPRTSDHEPRPNSIVAIITEATGILFLKKNSRYALNRMRQRSAIFWRFFINKKRSWGQIRLSKLVRQQFFLFKKIPRRNSPGDEIANVNFLYYDIVHALKIQ